MKSRCCAGSPASLTTASSQHAFPSALDDRSLDVTKRPPPPLRPGLSSRGLLHVSPGPGFPAPRPLRGITHFSLLLPGGLVLHALGALPVRAADPAPLVTMRGLCSAQCPTVAGTPERGAQVPGWSPYLSLSVWLSPSAGRSPGGHCAIRGRLAKSSCSHVDPARRGQQLMACVAQCGLLGCRWGL